MRIVALSDLHGHLPRIPPCDLLIVAGDVCPDRFGPFFAMQNPHHQKAWFDQVARPWLDDAPTASRILTWGNHDWCGQACSFRRDSPVETSAGELQILVDEATRIPVDSPQSSVHKQSTVDQSSVSRPSTVDRRPSTVSVWASPWSNQFMNWAFMKPPAELEAVYARIPEGIDILVSHQPPYGYGDLGLGSRELLAAIGRVKPKLVICGHIHHGFGRFTCDGTTVYNVSLVDDAYRVVHEPTVIDLLL